MVVRGVCRYRGYHRRWHRLGAHIDSEEPGSERWCCGGPTSAPHGGSGQKQVTLRLHCLIVWDRHAYAFFSMTGTSWTFERFGGDGRSLRQTLTQRSLAHAWVRSILTTRGRLSARQVFSFLA